MKRNRFHPALAICYFLPALCALFAGAAFAVHAHTVWIEPHEDWLAIRFAEPGKDFETSPGHLDGLSAPIAFIVVANAPSVVDAPKKRDYFPLDAASLDKTVCAEASFTVRAGRKPVFYARWQPANAGAGTPLLTLDLVPTGREGEARVYFRGKPLGGVLANLRTPDGKEQSLTAAANGLLRFKTAGPGQYLLAVAHHRESLAGFHKGIAYRETSHNCSLSWRQE